MDILSQFHHDPPYMWRERFDPLEIPELLSTPPKNTKNGLFPP